MVYISKSKELVERILRTNQLARNSYTWLYIEVMRAVGFKIPVNEYDVSLIPSPETILKEARRIQNREHKYMPDEDVQNMRKQHQNHFQKVVPAEENIGLWRNSQFS